MTDRTFGEIVSLLSETYGIEFTDERAKVWRVLLDPLVDDAAKATAIWLCQTSPYLPKPADLFRAIHGTPEDQERALDEEAELALRHVAQGICDYRINDWHSPVLHAFARLLGGVDAIVAMMDSGEWRMRWRDHKTLYKAIRRRGVSQDSPEAAALTPQAISEGLVTFGLEKYAEHGLPVPIEVRPFAPQTLPALPAKGDAA